MADCGGKHVPRLAALSALAVLASPDLAVNLLKQRKALRQFTTNSLVYIRNVYGVAWRETSKPVFATCGFHAANLLRGLLGSLSSKLL